MACCLQRRSSLFDSFAPTRLAQEPADFFGKAPLADEPTDARPGTEEKIRVLQARATARQSLFHPEDAHADPESMPGPRLRAFAGV